MIMRIEEGTEETPVFKVLLVGNSGVGKSALLLRFNDGAYNPDDMSSTIGVDLKPAFITVHNEKVKLMVWVNKTYKCHGFFIFNLFLLMV